MTLHRFAWNKHVKWTFVTVIDGDIASAAASGLSQDDREHESAALVSEFVA